MSSDRATTQPRAVDRPTSPRGLRRHKALLIPLSLALISRLVAMVGADLFMLLAFNRAHGAAPFTGPLAVWQRKDAVWYITIAEKGYTYSQIRANFFPLFPAVIHLLTPFARLLPITEPSALTGMAISWITFSIACILLYQLVLRRFGAYVAVGAVALLCLFPFGLYYGVAYTESIYLMLAVGAFLAVECGNWWIAGALAGIASASRPPGLLVGVCVTLAYLLDWLRTRHSLRANVLALALTPVGALAYALYCWARWGDPLAYLNASKAGWNGGHLQLNGVRYIAHVLRHPVSFIGPRNPNHIITLFAIALMLSFLALTPLVLRLLGPVYALFTLASILAPILDFPTANSLGRYLSVIFPIFIVVAYLLRDHLYLRMGFYLVGALLLVSFATYFIAGYGLS